ncbi:MAG TPA: RDD family protein [Vicinamibacterales bacterium]|nr:RDD family protein [Vicinamibacterales bacterium]
MTPPEKLTIETPEQIALEFVIAGAGSRFLAIAIDTLIQLALLLGLALVAVVTGALVVTAGGTVIGKWIAAALIAGGFLLYYGYYAGFEAVWGGQTPGKRVVGLRVITLSGQPITTYDAILRNLLRIVDQLPGIYAVGVLSIFFTEKHQRIGDLVAGTVVVQEVPASARDFHAAPATSVRLGAARLTAEEVEVIETFLGRRDDIPDYVRRRTASQLAARIRERLQLPLAGHTDDERLIETVAGEYRGR